MDNETKKAYIMWGGIALLVALYFGGRAIYIAYENQQQQIETLTKQQQTAQQQAQNAQAELQQIENQTPNLSTIISTWRPIVGHVACQFNDGNILLGSSTLVIPSDGSEKYVITNLHVIDEDLSGNYASSCAIKFPLDDTIFDASNPDASGGSDFTVATNNSDNARIYLSSIDDYLENMTTEGRHMCDSIPNVGDSIVILGYPSIGSQTDITATQGIISGYDGDYYITSAGIDHGNSGGAAIDETNNCYLGIPTWVESGSFESLGRILKWQAF